MKPALVPSRVCRVSPLGSLVVAEFEHATHAFETFTRWAEISTVLGEEFEQEADSLFGSEARLVVEVCLIGVLVGVGDAYHGDVWGHRCSVPEFAAVTALSEPAQAPLDAGAALSARLIPE